MMLLCKRVFNSSAFNFQLAASQRKLFSSQTVDWENAKPFEEIPGPKNSFQFLKMMIPGGKYHKLPLDKLVSAFRDDYGTLTRFPGFLGLKPMMITFLAEDIETMHRQEGKFPQRRVLDSIAFFRKQHRPDMYPAGAGLTIT